MGDVINKNIHVTINKDKNSSDCVVYVEQLEDGLKIKFIDTFEECVVNDPKHFVHLHDNMTIELSFKREIS